MLALGLQGARGSSSQGFTMALLLPASFMKKYVPPRPSRLASGSCSGQPLHQFNNCRPVAHATCLLP